MSRERETNSKTLDGGDLPKRVLELERQVADLEMGLAMQASGGEKALITALSEVRARLDQVEKENHEFANMYVEIQEQNEALTNLYVASQRLHATFDLDEVKQIITEILAEMVGAEEFGLLVLDREKKNLLVLAGEGIRERLPKETLPVGEGIIGDVARTGESFYFVPK
ncbi:MAG TPA: GAF domain-containing protein, partial [Vicinamibacteria bacterium]|nr:GAF domain-containing protein [Vicinamibacteria bacterium]